VSRRSGLVSCSGACSCFQTWREITRKKRRLLQGLLPYRPNCLRNGSVWHVRNAENLKQTIVSWSTLPAPANPPSNLKRLNSVWKESIYFEPKWGKDTAREHARQNTRAITKQINKRLMLGTLEVTIQTYRAGNPDSSGYKMLHHPLFFIWLWHQYFYQPFKFPHRNLRNASTSRCLPTLEARITRVWLRKKKTREL